MCARAFFSSLCFQLITNVAVNGPADNISKIRAIYAKNCGISKTSVIKTVSIAHMWRKFIFRNFVSRIHASFPQNIRREIIWQRTHALTSVETNKLSPFGNAMINLFDSPPKMNETLFKFWWFTAHERANGDRLCALRSVNRFIRKMSVMTNTENLIKIWIIAKKNWREPIYYEQSLTAVPRVNSIRLHMCKCCDCYMKSSCLSHEDCIRFHWIVCRHGSAH